MKAHPPARLRCPHCQAAVLRIRRNFADRCLSLFVPMVRYRCAAFQCGWEGLVRRSTPGTGGWGHGASYLPSQVLEPSRWADDTLPLRGAAGPGRSPQR
jgi:hypothetical protein